jgi:hypothetical protein
MQHLSYHNSYTWPVFIPRNYLNTELFLRTCLGVGIHKKGPYYTERGEMTDGCWWQKVWCGIVCISRGVWGKMFLYFFQGLKSEHFLKQNFGYTALHCAFIDRIWSVKCICMVCLCKYHNWVTQGVGSLLNLVGPTPTRRCHGWHRAGIFWKFWVSRSLEMAFSLSSFLLFVIIEIRTLYMVFKFKNFFAPPLSRCEYFFDPPYL